jgi:hypothetical protein
VFVVATQGQLHIMSASAVLFKMVIIMLGRRCGTKDRTSYEPACFLPRKEECTPVLCVVVFSSSSYSPGSLISALRARLEE